MANQYFDTDDLVWRPGGRFRKPQIHINAQGVPTGQPHGAAGSGTGGGNTGGGGGGTGTTEEEEDLGVLGLLGAANVFGEGGVIDQQAGVIGAAQGQFGQNAQDLLTLGGQANQSGIAANTALTGIGQDAIGAGTAANDALTGIGGAAQGSALGFGGTIGQLGADAAGLSNVGLNTGGFNALAEQQAGIASGQDPRFAEFQSAQLAQLGANETAALGQTSNFFGRRGSGGSTASLNALQRQQSGFDLQRTSLTSGLGLQQMARQDQALVQQGQFLGMADQSAVAQQQANLSAISQAGALQTSAAGVEQAGFGANAAATAAGAAAANAGFNTGIAGTAAGFGAENAGIQTGIGAIGASGDQTGNQVNAGQTNLNNQLLPIQFDLGFQAL